MQLMGIASAFRLRSASFGGRGRLLSFGGHVAPPMLRASALPPRTDIVSSTGKVRKVPVDDMCALSDKGADGLLVAFRQHADAINDLPQMSSFRKEWPTLGCCQRL
jgi:hypothetical protein